MEQLEALSNRTSQLQSQIELNDQSVHTQMQELASSFGLAQEESQTPQKQQVTSFLGQVIQQQIEQHSNAKDTGDGHLRAHEQPTGPSNNSIMQPAELQQAQVAPSAAEAYRQAQLGAVFREFDLNNSGSISEQELFELGKARRELGQAGGNWTPEQSKRLIQKMDKDQDGLIGEAEFVEYFSSVLPQNADDFETEVKQFMDAAKSCRIQPFDPIYDVVLNLQRDVSQNKVSIEKEVARIKRQVNSLQRSMNQGDY
eukprot:TRINITY_DN5798_c0_g1_i2.p1 TRINITY_DN5798_c0_g1~~TRINITY_DN5798_c0_g1_i2.p1  ORF type:complete len:256 (-),score=64.19 TRINITY_DN5798_c0_g1_i2:26-793(-)